MASTREERVSRHPQPARRSPTTTSAPAARKAAARSPSRWTMARTETDLRPVRRTIQPSLRATRETVTGCRWAGERLGEASACSLGDSRACHCSDSFEMYHAGCDLGGVRIDTWLGDFVFRRSPDFTIGNAAAGGWGYSVSRAAQGREGREMAPGSFRSSRRWSFDASSTRSACWLSGWARRRVRRMRSSSESTSTETRGQADKDSAVQRQSSAAA